ncbi:Conserved_hypothetical protein [Hexamita inflata]|uniref:Uncharacterized protein n=1 Tax=Hexamita inflata TaxID=28002 RepID=A0AA86PL01_9EUKA|nr:Conserved hypothetical protein [Hexamita inflata]
MLKQVQFLVVLSKIDQEIIQNYTTQLIYHLLTYAGFDSTSWPDNGSQYYYLAKQSMFTELISYFQKSKQKFSFQPYTLPDQYNEILDKYGVVISFQDSEPQHMQGNYALICKLLSSALESMTSVMTLVKIPADCKKLILLKAIQIIKQFSDNKEVKSFMEYQLIPKILMIVIRIFETQPNFNQYMDIVQLFGYLITNTNVMQASFYQQILSQFLAVVSHNILNSVEIKYKFGEVENNMSYVNPVLFCAKQSGEFGRMLPIYSYSVDFIKTNSVNAVMFMSYIDKIITQLYDENVEHIDTFYDYQMDLVEYVCNSFPQESLVVDFCIKLLSQSPTYIYHVSCFIKRIIYIKRDFFLENSLEVIRLIQAIFAWCCKNDDAQDTLLLHTSFICTLHAHISYVEIQQLIVNQAKMMRPILINCLFANDELIVFSEQFLQFLYEETQKLILTGQNCSKQLSQFQCILTQMKLQQNGRMQKSLVKFQNKILFLGLILLTASLESKPVLQLIVDISQNKSEQSMRSCRLMVENIPHDGKAKLDWYDELLKYMISQQWIQVDEILDIAMQHQDNENVRQFICQLLCASHTHNSILYNNVLNNMLQSTEYNMSRYFFELDYNCLKETEDLNDTIVNYLIQQIQCKNTMQLNRFLIGFSKQVKYLKIQPEQHKQILEIVFSILNKEDKQNTLSCIQLLSVLPSQLVYDALRDDFCVVMFSIALNIPSIKQMILILLGNLMSQEPDNNLVAQFIIENQIQVQVSQRIIQRGHIKSNEVIELVVILAEKKKIDKIKVLNWLVSIAENDDEVLKMIGRVAVV